MFVAALFTIAKTRRQPKCTSTDEWIKKIHTHTHTHTNTHTHTHTMEYHPAIKKNEIMPFAATRMHLEMIIPSEVKPERDKFHMILLICGI